MRGMIRCWDGGRVEDESGKISDRGETEGTMDGGCIGEVSGKVSEEEVPDGDGEPSGEDGSPDLGGEVADHEGRSESVWR